MRKLEKQLQEIERLIRAVRYEIAVGVHTFSKCVCGRCATRSGRCKLCLLDDMVDVLMKAKG